MRQTASSRNESPAQPKTCFAPIFEPIAANIKPAPRLPRAGNWHDHWKRPREALRDCWVADLSGRAEPTPERVVLRLLSPSIPSAEPSTESAI
jgi:hypothetical protein